MKISIKIFWFFLLNLNAPSRTLIIFYDCELKLISSDKTNEIGFKTHKYIKEIISVKSIKDFIIITVLRFSIFLFMKFSKS